MKFWKLPLAMAVVLIGVTVSASATRAESALGHLLYDQEDGIYYCVGTPLNCEKGAT